MTRRGEIEERRYTRDYAIAERHGETVSLEAAEWDVCGNFYRTVTVELSETEAMCLSVSLAAAAQEKHNRGAGT